MIVLTMALSVTLTAKLALRIDTLRQVDAGRSLTALHLLVRLKDVSKVVARWLVLGQLRWVIDRMASHRLEAVHSVHLVLLEPSQNSILLIISGVANVWHVDEINVLLVGSLLCLDGLQEHGGCACLLVVCAHLRGGSSGWVGH